LSIDAVVNDVFYCLCFSL